MSDDRLHKALRIRPDKLRELLAEISDWLTKGNLSKPGWFQVEHPKSTSEWVVRIDVEPPLTQARWHRDAELPTPPWVFALEPAAVETPQAPTDEAFVKALRDWALQDAIGSLTAQERDCLELVVDGRMSVREAAAYLDMSYSTVWRRLRAAKAKLFKDMSSWYEDKPDELG